MTDSKPQKYCQVLLPGPFEAAFDYAVPESEPVGEPALSHAPCASQQASAGASNKPEPVGEPALSHAPCASQQASAGASNKPEPVGEPALSHAPCASQQASAGASNKPEPAPPRLCDGGALVTIGSLVEAPFGRRMAVGIVTGFAAPEIDIKKIKPIAKISPLPPLNAGMMDFINWMAAYSMQPPGMIADMALFDAEAPFGIELNHYRLSGTKPSSPAEKRIASVLADKVLSGAELLTSARIAVRTIEKAAANGFIVCETGELQKKTPSPPEGEGWVGGAVLSPIQQNAADELITAVQAKKYQPFLLDGVTGSGKTEVYFAAIASAIADGRQSLVLLPEIALTIPWQERFERHFGFAPLVWHSGLGDAKRRRHWQIAANGEAPVIVGARSALLLPLPRLGLIIVDEEHDSSYKQEEQVLYHARDMAVARARHENVPVVLASATPSLETVENAASGRYRELSLPSRHGGAELPEVTIIDMRQEKLPATRFLSHRLVTEISIRAARGEQSLLFLNRRGYAPLTLCRSCGHRFQCDNCSAWLVLHKEGVGGRLRCHHCGKSHPIPSSCPVCAAEYCFAACGPGVQRLADEAAELMPGIRQGIIASDNITTPAEAAEFFGRVDSGEIQLLIGTQMIAKGHHFPKLTLVGVVDADLGLNGGDPRAAERSFQLLHQVTGRAGREELAGQAFLQTYQPEHPVIKAIAACDRKAFNDLERDIRRSAGLPPFGRLAAVIISGDDEAAVRAFAAYLARKIPHAEGISVLGPSPAPMYKLRGDFRLRFLLKSGKETLLQPVIKQWLGGIAVPRGINLRADIDPQSFV